MNAFAQPPAHTPRFNTGIDNNINGFWEYLPRNYQTDAPARYPLLIFLHGAGEQGSIPDTPTLNKVLRAGTPRLINTGNFPDSFYVSNQWFKFIVLSPQIKVGISGSTSIVSPTTIEAMIQYARSAYRVDDSRIYVFGLSMGGGATWDYAGGSINAARKLAAIIPAAGAADLTPGQAGNIATAELPVLATHNLNDNVILASRTQANIAAINMFTPALHATPRAIYWSTGGHNVWTRTFESILAGAYPTGNATDTLGVNVYEWALQQFRPTTVLDIVWRSFTVRSINSAARLRWSVARAVNAKEFIVEKSSDGRQWNNVATITAQRGQASGEYEFTDNAPGPATVHYRILETEMNGRFSYSPVKTFTATGRQDVLIYPNPFAGELRIDAPLPEGNTVIRLADAAGRTLLLQKHEPAGLASELVLKGLDKLAPGNYYITISDAQGKPLLTRQLLKK